MPSPYSKQQIADQLGIAAGRLTIAHSRWSRAAQDLQALIGIAGGHSHTSRQELEAVAFYMRRLQDIADQAIKKMKEEK